MLTACPQGVKLHIKLTPSARNNAITRIENGRLRVSVTTVAEKGKANIAFLNFLSKKLQLPKRQFQLIAGHTARLKTVLIEGDGKVLMPYLEARLETLGITHTTFGQKGHT